VLFPQTEARKDPVEDIFRGRFSGHFFESGEGLSKIRNEKFWSTLGLFYGTT